MSGIVNNHFFKSPFRIKKEMYFILNLKMASWEFYLLFQNNKKLFYLTLTVWHKVC